ncbi:hypothetical protein OG974_05125 [Streptomyces sp. NBC_00597]|uniref:hypothetical protein n=1 Tax=Streptomyces sp. NBC_00597 TaxID=2975786 RepID=UPI0030E4EE73
MAEQDVDTVLAAVQRDIGRSPAGAPNDAAAEVVVYRRSGTGFSRLWAAIGSGDDAEIDRTIARATDVAVHGPSEFWARGLGD